MHIVLVGGGHSHAIALRKFGQSALPGLQLTLISDQPAATYSGMLPGYIAGCYRRRQCQINLVDLAKFAGASLIIDQVIGLDLSQQQVICSQGSPVKFDYLSLNTGIVSAKLGLDHPHSIAVKPLGQFLQAWQRLLADVGSSNSLKLAIAGGGVGGIELALAMERRLGKMFGDRLQVRLADRGTKLLPSHNAQVRSLVEQVLAQRRIRVDLEAEVTSWNPSKSDYLFWATQATAPLWLARSGLATNAQGFVLINNRLQSLSHPQVFATGDIATNPSYPRPKAGVFAVRQGLPLWQNLTGIAKGQPLVDYIPQAQFLSLINTADGQAIASWGKWGWRSPLAWWWKQWLDSSFMAQFEHLA
ncbi:MAG: FAD-dependent oxidoreductase [Pseudanabaenaceae cyanobacterium bins.68]|nr:FAD-dependent oxidoreductase [Pseudanabaenaceae cyanobacterium bins.68]